MRDVLNLRVRDSPCPVEPFCELIQIGLRLRAYFSPYNVYRSASAHIPACVPLPSPYIVHTGGFNACTIALVRLAAAQFYADVFVAS